MEKHASTSQPPDKILAYPPGILCKLTYMEFGGFKE
jgi:hypothetical protein